MDNRAGEMQVFATAAELASFSAAGRRLRMSPSAVSKLVTRLEDRLGVRLLTRSTRALQLTVEGEAFLTRARRILAEIEEAERLVTGDAQPRGRLRVNASVGFGVRCVLPVVPEFLRLYPHVELDLSLTDTVIDLLEERTDIALRAGPLRDSTLMARKLMESPRVIVASPAYLARHGTPQRPEDLDHHNCLRFNFRRLVDDWPFRIDGRQVTRAVPGNLYGNTGDMLLRLCLDGVGLARVGRFHAQPWIEEGRLVPVLEDYNAGDIEIIHALFVGHEHMAARVRAFIDFLAERVGQPRITAA
ncbi:LysR family transcriptional regulator [Rhodovarius crocodyli]|uniref:LysR family transcriptional regulator n=2 Tax=Rhodovarius crocodyli TaxID=1979269 RepID=A0A437MIL5_9PROT|nr:LysR family transcriptional regulator [Rhodovarius crocodyli]RVT97498.1 LysR family transcriptional regulator [Rhodovarius crocodyli]